MTDHIELAKYYQSLKSQGLTLAEVGSVVGKGPAHVSRYISLLKLPEEAQRAVSNGDLPVRDAAKIWKKSKLKSTPRADIPESANEIYRLIGDKTIITANQISRFLKKSIASVRRGISECESRGLIECHNEIRPFVYRLSSSGAGRLGKSFQRRWISGNAMHQHLMKNEIALNHWKTTGNYFLNRVDLYRLGFHPGVAEHVLISGGRKILVIIDDYNMPLHKIGFRISRFHNPDKKYYQGDKMKWIFFIDDIVIFTTKFDRVGLHKKSIAEEITKFSEIIKINYGDTREEKEVKKSMKENFELIKPFLEKSKVSYLSSVLRVF